jgi:hypothetical protein
MGMRTHAAIRKSAGSDHVRTTARRVLLSCCIALIARASGAENADPSPKDFAVMQATVIQFAGTSDCYYGRGRAGITVDTASLSMKGFLSDEALKSQLAPDFWSEIAPMTGAARARNAQSQTIDWRFASEAVKVKNLNVVSDKDFDALLKTTRCMVAVALPAYSASGTEALVAMRVMPDYHGALAVFLVERAGDGWKVEKQHLFEFI